MNKDFLGNLVKEGDTIICVKGVNLHYGIIQRIDNPYQVKIEGIRTLMPLTNLVKYELKL